MHKAPAQELLSPATTGAHAAAHTISLSPAVVARKRRRALLTSLNLAAILIVVLGPLIIYPLLRLLWLSVDGAHGLSLQAYQTFFSDPETRGVQEFNRLSYASRKLFSVIVPLRDGVMVSRRR